MNSVAIVAAIIVSIFVGSLATLIVIRSMFKSKTSGTVRPAYDSDDGVYLFLDLDVEPTVILKDKYVIFNVNPEDISQN